MKLINFLCILASSLPFDILQSILMMTLGDSSTTHIEEAALTWEPQQRLDPVVIWLIRLQFIIQFIRWGLLLLRVFEWVYDNLTHH